jgi:hypothetical protein
VSGLVQEHLHDGIGRKVQRFSSEQYLAAHISIGDPPCTPPVPELHEPATLDPGAEHNHHVGHVRVMSLDRVPHRFAGGNECTRFGRTTRFACVFLAIVLHDKE